MNISSRIIFFRHDFLKFSFLLPFREYVVSNIMNMNTFGTNMRKLDFDFLWFDDLNEMC